MDEYNAWNDPYLQAQMSGLGLAADLAGTTMTNIYNQQNVEETNKTNKEINEANIAANRELWQLNAEYNSLKNQVARAREAGFSPAALLGTSGFNSSTSPTSVPSPIAMQAFRAENPQVGKSIATMVGALSEINQLRKTKAEAEGVEIDNQRRDALNRANVERVGNEADKIKQEYDFFDMNWNNAQRKAEAEAYRAYEEGQKAKFEADITRIEDYIQSRYGESEKVKQLNIMDRNLSLINEQIKNAVKEGKNIDAARQEIFSRVNLNNVNARMQQRYIDYFDDVFQYRVNQEKREGQRAWYDYLFDQAHYMDVLYNDFEKNKYSVDSAREMLNTLKAQRKKAEMDNQFYVADKITNYIQTIESGIMSAKKGRFLDANIESMKAARNGYRETIIRKATDDGFYQDLQRTPLGN